MQDSLKSIWQRFTRRQSACERYETLISLYADGMASQKEARLAEAHVAVCPQCRVFLSSIRAMAGALAKPPAQELPAGLSERLRLAIAQERLREQGPVSAPARRTPTRALVPRLALAGTLACAVIAAAVVHDLRSSQQNTPLAIGPAKVAVAPKTRSAAPASHGISQIAPPKSTKIALSQGTAGQFDIKPVISHRKAQSGIERIASPRLQLAQGGAKTVSVHLTSVVGHSGTAHSPQTHHAQIATNPSLSVGGSGLAKTHKPAGEQEARLPARPIIPDVYSDVHQSLPPAVNNATTGEQPTVVAAVPQTQPTPAAPEDSPRVRLASRLHLIADNSTRAAQQIATITAKEQRNTEYSGSLAIVGSSIR